MATDSDILMDFNEYLYVSNKVFLPKVLAVSLKTMYIAINSQEYGDERPRFRQ